MPGQSEIRASRPPTICPWAAGTRLVMTNRSASQRMAASLRCRAPDDTAKGAPSQERSAQQPALAQTVDHQPGPGQRQYERPEREQFQPPAREGFAAFPVHYVQAPEEVVGAPPAGADCGQLARLRIDSEGRLVLSVE